MQNTTKINILVVEDDMSIAEIICTQLDFMGYTTTHVETGQEALNQIFEHRFDLVVIDWMLPNGLSGMDLIRRWRREPETQQLPIIMLTARSSDQDVVQGLEQGADDYLTKPFSAAQLQARVRAVLRRSNSMINPQIQYEIGALSLNTQHIQVTYEGKLIKLSPAEFELLAYFMKHPHKVHDRSGLLRHVWQQGSHLDERTVDVHIKRLRQALGVGGTYIETVRGFGYRLSLPAPEASP